MAEISTLVTDIYDLFDPKKTHTPDEENLSEFAENIKDLLRTRLSQREDFSSPLRFSSLGKPDRQIWYKGQGLQEEELKSRTYFLFLYGDVIEQLCLFLAKEAGHEVTHEQAEVEVLGVKGHIDAVIDGVVVDVKSASPLSYKKFAENNIYGDIFSKQYIDQLCGYSNVLTPGHSPAFLAFNKVSGDICLLPISSSIAADHKPEERIAHLKEVLANPEPPPRCYPDEEEGKSGNRKLSVGCSYCGYKKHCYPTLRGFAYSGGPRYLTRVIKTPDVPEFEV